MASKAVVDAVETFLAANWTETPIIGINTTGDAPADGSPFLAVQYPVANESVITMASVGNRTFREEGAFRIVFAIARGQGQAQGLQWIDTLRGLFRAATIGVVRCGAPSATINNDANEAGNYYRISFAVPYYADIFA